MLCDVMMFIPPLDPSGCPWPECDHSRCSPTNTVTHTKNSAQSRSPRAAGAGRVPSPRQTPGLDTVW